MPQEDLHRKATLVWYKSTLLNNTIGDESSISTNDLIQWIFYNNSTLDDYTRQVLLSNCQYDSTAPHYSVYYARGETSNRKSTIFFPSNGVERSCCQFRSINLLNM